MTKAEGTGVQTQIRSAAVEIRDESVVQSATLYLVARKLLLASLGTVAFTAQEAAEFVDRLVERGEVAEADVRRMLSELQNRESEPSVVPTEEEPVGGSSSANEDHVETILGRLNVPTRNDIEELSRKISALDGKIGKLKEKRQSPET